MQDWRGPEIQWSRDGKDTHTQRWRLCEQESRDWNDSRDTRKGKIILQQPPNLGRVMGEFPLEFKMTLDFLLPKCERINLYFIALSHGALLEQS